MISQVTEAQPAGRSTLTTGGAGRVMGLFLCGMYALWTLFVVSGLAQSLMNAMASLHVIRPVYVIEQVDPSRLASLLLIAAALGYVLGGVFALSCKRMSRGR